MEVLRKDEDIILLPADKGRCTMVLDKSTYISKIMDLLSDVETYEVIVKYISNCPLEFTMRVSIIYIYVQ